VDSWGSGESGRSQPDSKVVRKLLGCLAHEIVDRLAAGSRGSLRVRLLALCERELHRAKAYVIDKRPCVWINPPQRGAERHSQNALVGVSSAATSEPAARRYRRRSALAARGHLLHPAKHPVARPGKSVTGEKPWHHVSKRVSCSLAEPTTSGQSTHS
jgi:hypothetical protein